MDVALAKYTKQTGKDLRNHPLAFKINQRDSAESILAVFNEQAQEFDEFRNGNSKLIKWLQPIVSGLYTLSNSSALRDGVNHVSPSKFLQVRSQTVLSNAVVCRFSPLDQRFSLGSVSYYLYVSFHTLPIGTSDIRDLPDGQVCEGKLRRPRGNL